MERLLGISIAAPTPWNPRPASRKDRLGANAQASEAVAALIATSPCRLADEDGRLTPFKMPRCFVIQSRKGVWKSEVYSGLSPYESRGHAAFFPSLDLQTFARPSLRDRKRAVNEVVGFLQFAR